MVPVQSVTIAPEVTTTVDPGVDHQSVCIIEPLTGWQALGLSEIWHHRELAFFLAWRDVKVRYKQTVLGAAWAVLQPLLAMLVFSIFFGRLGRMDQLSPLPYPLVVYAALLPWQFFSTCVNQASQSLISSANLISKVYFPRLLVPLATLGVGLVDFVVSSVLLVGLMIRYQVTPPAEVILIPVLALALLLVTLGVGAFLAALAVAYRDIRYVVPFMIQLWMFACPVPYPLSIVPEQWRWAYSLNPVAGIIGGFRACLLGEPLDLVSLGVSLTMSVLLFLGGIVYFRKVERRFADIV